jgi:very-short-patch-repair endonuclease
VPVADDERTVRGRIPVTTVPRTLLDLAGVLDASRLALAWEESDRLGLLRLASVDALCRRAGERNGIGTIRRLLSEARYPEAANSPLEDRFLAFCRAQRLPAPQCNVFLLGREVDALWPSARLVVELDGFAYHAHRAAFESDRARDARLLVAGFRTLRVTHRRLLTEGQELAAELRLLLGTG